jgi:hypothetical protein
MADHDGQPDIGGLELPEGLENGEQGPMGSGNCDISEM